MAIKYPKTKPLPPRPRTGQIIDVHGAPCRIVKVHTPDSLGTVDVESVDGKRAWRVTGLIWKTEA